MVHRHGDLLTNEMSEYRRASGDSQRSQVPGLSHCAAGSGVRQPFQALSYSYYKRQYVQVLASTCHSATSLQRGQLYQVHTLHHLSLQRVQQLIGCSHGSFSGQEIMYNNPILPRFLDILLDSQLSLTILQSTGG